MSFKVHLKDNGSIPSQKLNAKEVHSDSKFFIDNIRIEFLSIANVCDG